MWTDPEWFIYQLEVRICFDPRLHDVQLLVLDLSVSTLYSSFFNASSLLYFDHIQIKKIRYHSPSA